MRAQTFNARTSCVGRKQFFFAKKNQKTFPSWGARYGTARTKQQKFFGSFLQKRTLPFLTSKVAPFRA
jgi:hypothetical protein